MAIKKHIEDSFFEFFDIVLFDLQDVGVRFYTYISTLHYVMESCAKNKIQLVVFDRPNPHLQYIDGPVLDMKYKSFVGMHPVPVVYGMTIGEYSKMINGQKWLNSGLVCDLIVIKIKNYKRSDIMEYNVPPSPNLTNLNSILLYPSLCFFEGTIISVGRGTDFLSKFMELLFLILILFLNHHQTLVQNIQNIMVSYVMVMIYLIIMCLKLLLKK